MKSSGSDDGSKGDIDSESPTRLGKSKVKETRLRMSGYRKLMTLVRDGRRAPFSRGRSSAGKSSSGGKWMPALPRLHMQQVAVRLTYAKNKGDGQWHAHGRYLEREAAVAQGGDARGFGHDGDAMPISKTLDQWQKADDKNLFKLIISPEQGERLDLREYTAAYIAQLEKELGTKLQWVAAAHYNTDHPHVHVALRGMDDKGRALVIPREFIRGPLRTVAQDLATQRIGHRTELDIQDARDRQVTQHRFTDLDRMLLRRGRAGENGVVVDFGTALPGSAKSEAKETRLQLLRRLSTLETLGLATRGEGGQWLIDPATETLLRERQKANDRLKTAFSHRAMSSDPRIPLAPAPEGDARIAGRLIGTGLDDASGKAYMLLETTDARMIYIYQSRSAEKAAAQGLKPGDFLVVNQRERTEETGRKFRTDFVRRVGPDEAVLKDAKAMREEVRHYVQDTGELPQRSTWGGWLGKFHGERHEMAVALVERGVIRAQGGRYEFTDQRAKTRGAGRT